MGKQLFAAILLFAATAAPMQAQAAAPLAQGASQQAAVRIRVSGNVMSAKLLRPVVAPIYPALAKTARIQGTVRFWAVIGTDGRVVSLKVLAGDSLLIKSARDAVQQWRYQPTLLNGKPVEVLTQINVIFTLGPESGPPLMMPTAQEQAAELSSERATMASVDPQTAGDVLRLLHLTGTRFGMPQLFSSTSAALKTQLVNALAGDPEAQQIADQFVKKMNEQGDSDVDFYNLLVAVYAKHFTDEELKQAIAFYESPAGRKFVSAQPSLQQELRGAAMSHWELVLVPEIVKELSKQFPEIKKRVKYTTLPSSTN